MNDKKKKITQAKYSHISTKILCVYIKYFYSKVNTEYDDLDLYIKNVNALIYYFIKRILDQKNISHYILKTEYVLTLDIHKLKIPCLLKEMDNVFYLILNYE